MNNHQAAIQKITEANKFIDDCNKGKQKLVDAKNSAEAKLKTEKDKVKKLRGEITALKKKIPKGKKSKANAAEAEEDSGEIAKLQDELEKADQEVKRLTKDVRDKELQVKDMEKRLKVQDRVAGVQAGKLLDAEKNLQSAVQELSELKSRIHMGLVAPNAGSSAPDAEVVQLKQENTALQKENETLKRKLQEMSTTDKKSNGNKGVDPHAGKRNSDVNKALEKYVNDYLSRSVVFIATDQDEEAAIGMVWDALKTKEQLETYHKLSMEDFALYYGPKLKEFVQMKRSNLQASMKKAARGEQGYRMIVVFCLPTP